MPHLDPETFDTYRKAASLVSLHEGQFRQALERRRDYFVTAATDTRRAHLAGALSEPAEEGHVLLLDNAGLQQVSLMFTLQAEATVRALKALNEATGEDYTYEIEWEVAW